MAPSGEQFEIAGFGFRAILTECGATLRLLEHEGLPLVDTFAVEAMTSAGMGQLLMPWPNRIRDGQYADSGRELQLPLSEPDRHNASHGLVRWAAWTLVEHTPSSVLLRYRLMAQSGYPWTLDLTARYELSDQGLTCTQSATNCAATPAPYAQGAHPYLRLGPGPVDTWELSVPAATRGLSDPERFLPTGREAVEGTDYDFRDARVLGALEINHAYTDFDRDADGRATAWLRDPGTGRAVGVWVDEHWPWLMIYTGDERSPARLALAIEPMTANADAFRSGEDLLHLAPAGRPGATFEASWGITPQLPVPR